MNQTQPRKPDWLKRPLPQGSSEPTQRLIRKLGLNTVCKEAGCPNKQECFSKQTATFLIGGKFCTRNCKFCSVESGRPEEIDPEEPEKIAKAAKEMNLKYVVITSVTRDDLTDGLANHFRATIQAIRCLTPEVSIEVLTPDFKGRRELIEIVLKEMPQVFNHNIETVRRLTPLIRSESDYKRSLSVLKLAASYNPKIKIKSGLMVGLGERCEEIVESLVDLKEAGYMNVDQIPYRQTRGCAVHGPRGRGPRSSGPQHGAVHGPLGHGPRLLVLEWKQYIFVE